MTNASSDPPPAAPEETSADEAAVSIQDLRKSYGDTLALDGTNVSIREGELFGFIGPDGAGKTTLFRILNGLLRPDEGTATVTGFDAEHEYRAIRQEVGYMPGRFSLYGDLSIEENLNFFASVFGTVPEEQMDLIGPVYKQIEPFKERRAAALSGGMKQKLALCCALVHRPKVLLLDEPTTGVDAVSRQEFWDVLTDLKGGDLTILVSTPYMDEAIRCDRVALIDQGSILKVDHPEAIGEAYEWPLLAVQGPDRYRLLRDLRTYDHARSVFPFGEDIHVTDERKDGDPDQLSDELRAWLHEKGHPETTVRPISADIEDAFMALMGDANETATPPSLNDALA